MMLNSKSIGNKIAEARKKNNLSQSELAQQVAISAQAVGKWERGESMPDISTLNRLAEILGVDLNYFSDSFQSVETIEANTEKPLQPIIDKPKKSPGWNMSESNWENLDFSGLKNLQEKFSSSNIKNCKFIGSDLSELLLKGNNIDGCDFSGSEIINSTFQRSNIANNSFKNCSLKNTEFTGSFITGCDFTNADLTDVVIKSGGFEKSIVTDTIWNRTSFIAIRIANVIFEGNIDDCVFERCSFSKVTFQNATLTNTFFKYNVLKRIVFINCRADRMTYELLKHGKADLTEIALIP